MVMQILTAIVFMKMVRALAKYVDFEVIHVSTNADAKPWCDTCLVAKKTGSLVNSGDNLERRMNNLENKLDAILNSIKK